MCMTARRIASILLCAFFAVASSWLFAGTAVAADGITLRGFLTDNGQVTEVTPKPLANPTPLCTVYFDRVVGIDEASPIKPSAEQEKRADANLGKVHLLHDGREVEDAKVVAVGGEGGAMLNLAIEHEGWLLPLAEYTVLVDAGVFDIETGAITGQPYSLTFKTSALCSNGLTLYENVLIAAVLVIVCVGIAVQALRVRRRAR